MGQTPARAEERREIVRYCRFVGNFSVDEPADLGWTPEPRGSDPTIAASPSGLNMTPVELPLWEDGAPGALGETDADKPTLTIYPAARVATARQSSSRPAAATPSWRWITRDARWPHWFNAMGISAFVLKYRLGPKYHHPIELGDAQRAIRIVAVESRGVRGPTGSDRHDGLFRRRPPDRDRGDPLRCRKGRRGRSDRAGRQPARLPHPRLSGDLFRSSHPHAGSERNLLGDNPDPKLVEDLSNELRVTAQTPPTFLFHTTNDPACRSRTASASIWR